MGKTPKPLTILCHPDIAAWDEIEALGKQGHAIVLTEGEAKFTESGEVDLILHPCAWRMDPAHRKYLPLAIAAGRAHRYPKEK